jgi:hypothetical protein
LAILVVLGDTVSLGLIQCVLVVVAVSVPAALYGQTVPDVGAPRVSALTPRGGPFGIYKGMTKAELERVAKVTSAEPGLYHLTRVPSPHSSFESYSVALTATLGVCKVFATSALISTNNFGTQLRSRFDDIAEAIEAKYGRGVHADYLRSGSLWEESRYWMMGLLEKDRTLSGGWQGTAAAPLPDGISAIALEALAASTDEGALCLTYDFDNIKPCIAEINKKKNSVF